MQKIQRACFHTAITLLSSDKQNWRDKNFFTAEQTRQISAGNYIGVPHANLIAQICIYLRGALPKCWDCTNSEFKQFFFLSNILVKSSERRKCQKICEWVIFCQLVGTYFFRESRTRIRAIFRKKEKTAFSYLYIVESWKINLSFLPDIEKQYFCVKVINYVLEETSRRLLN